MMKKIFSTSIDIKNKDKKEIVMMLFTFIIVPAVSVGIICCGKQSPLYNSLSRLAWPEGLLWLVYIWGAFNIGNLFLSTKMALDEGGYTKKWRQLFYGIFIASAVLMTVGISIPAYVDSGAKYDMMRTIHTAISSVGFFGFYFVLIIMSLTTLKRNRNQFTLLVCYVCFTLIIGVFALTKVYDPSSYCVVSAPAQVILFGLYNVGLTLCYFTMKLFKNEKLVADVVAVANEDSNEQMDDAMDEEKA